MKPISRILAPVLLLALSGALWAEPNSDATEFRTRRDALMAKVGSGVILVLGAEQSGSYSPFQQSNRFHYLTGIEEPAGALVLLPKLKRHVLFCTPTPEYLVRWEGTGLTPGKETEQRLLFDESRDYEDLPFFLNKILGTRAVTIHTPLAPEEVGRKINDVASPALRRRLDDILDERISREQNLKEKLNLLFPKAAVKDLSPLLRKQRSVKTAWEINQMRRAAEVSVKGWFEVLRSTRPGLLESDLGAILGFHARMAGGSDFPYWPIVGSGDNANTLHYIRNHSRLKAGDLVLMDAAFGFGYYACDITRTFPVSGKFSDEQRKIYNDLLKAQKAVIAKVAPGVIYNDLAKECERMLLKAGYEKRHFVHYLGHAIGMAVHDPGDLFAPLVPGVVVTVEPGLYFPEKKMGFRIEDVVLVTPKGHENLTAALPKEADAIEKLMAGK